MEMTKQVQKFLPIKNKSGVSKKEVSVSQLNPGDRIRIEVDCIVTGVEPVQYRLNGKTQILCLQFLGAKNSPFQDAYGFVSLAAHDTVYRVNRVNLWWRNLKAWFDRVFSSRKKTN